MCHACGERSDGGEACGLRQAISGFEKLASSFRNGGLEFLLMTGG